jgi:hypothetical protein
MIEISKLMELNKCIHLNFLFYFNVSYDFSKFDGSRKIKVWHSYWYHPKVACPNVFTYCYLDIEKYCLLDLCFAFTYYIIILIMEGNNTCDLNRWSHFVPFEIICNKVTCLNSMMVITFLYLNGCLVLLIYLCMFLITF